MKLLIDGDILLYRNCFINEFSIKWDEQTTSEYLSLDEAKKDFDDFVKGLYKKTKTTEGLICFSSSVNFRYSVLPSYKHNRKELAKPKLYQDLKQYAIDNYPTKIKEPLEADDVMGIMATRYPGKYIIATLDKDLNQIPGLHYNWNKEQFNEVSIDDADWWFFMQVLTGDTGDGYSGCPKVGAKKAQKLLEETFYACLESEDLDCLNIWYWQAIEFEYEKRGLISEDALVQARVARILRAEDYDFEKGEVKLWTPNDKL